MERQSFVFILQKSVLKFLTLPLLVSSIAVRTSVHRINSSSKFRTCGRKMIFSFPQYRVRSSRLNRQHRDQLLFTGAFYIIDALIVHLPTPFPIRLKANPAEARQTHHSRPHSVKSLYFVSVHPMQKQQKPDICFPPDAYAKTHNMLLYLKYAVKNALSFSNGMMSI